MFQWLMYMEVIELVTTHLQHWEDYPEHQWMLDLEITPHGHMEPVQRLGEHRETGEMLQGLHVDDMLTVGTTVRMT